VLSSALESQAVPPPPHRLLALNPANVEGRGVTSVCITPPIPQNRAFGTVSDRSKRASPLRAVRSVSGAAPCRGCRRHQEPPISIRGSQSLHSSASGSCTPDPTPNHTTPPSRNNDDFCGSDGGFARAEAAPPTMRARFMMRMFSNLVRIASAFWCMA
jgi:hypothetical protein